MSTVEIYSSGGTFKYGIDAALSSNLHESLNGECTFDLTMPGKYLQGVILGDELRYGDYYFTVAQISRASQTAGALCTLNCEHVSYALTDMEMPEGVLYGSPTTGLTAILNGTGFSVGTVGVAGTWRLEIKAGTSRRDALQQWAAICYGELAYHDRSIDLLAHVGNNQPVNLSEAENVKSLTVTLDGRNHTQNYSVELSRLQTLGLGDAVTIQYYSLNVMANTRVMALDRDIFHPWSIRMVCGEYLPTYYNRVTQSFREIEESVSEDIQQVEEDIQQVETTVIEEIETEIREVMIRAQLMDFSDWSNGEFFEILDNGTIVLYGVEFDSSGRPIKITDDQHECTIVWE